MTIQASNTSFDPDRLINGHLDGGLSQDEQLALNEWIKADSANAKRFALAVMLDDRIALQYNSLKVTLEQLDSIRVTTSVRSSSSRRLAIVASVACLMLIAFFYSWTPSNPGPSREAAAVFRELVLEGRKSADRTYRITFVKDEAADHAQIPLKHVADQNNEKMLYIRGGRQFVCTWKTQNGQLFVTGSNDAVSWSMPPGGELKTEPPMRFTGGLPEREYLAPILNLYEQQEKVLAALYNLELRRKSKTQCVLVAGKKPDTKDGPRRIEIEFDPSTHNLSEMRIWPETPDHRKMSYTRIELVSSQTLDPNWFTPGFNHQPVNQRAADTPAAAD